MSRMMSLSLASSSSRLMELYVITSSRCCKNRSSYLLRKVVVSVGCVTGVSGRDSGKYCFGMVLKCFIFLWYSMVRLSLLRTSECC